MLTEKEITAKLVGLGIKYAGEYGYFLKPAEYEQAVKTVNVFDEMQAKLQAAEKMAVALEHIKLRHEQNKKHFGSQGVYLTAFDAELIEATLAAWEKAEKGDDEAENKTL